MQKLELVRKVPDTSHLSLDYPTFEYALFLSARFLVEVNNHQTWFFANFDQMVTLWTFHSQFSKEIRAHFQLSAREFCAKASGNWRNYYTSLSVTVFFKIPKLFTILRVLSTSFLGLKGAADSGQFWLVWLQLFFSSTLISAHFWISFNETNFLEVYLY